MTLDDDDDAFWSELNEEAARDCRVAEQGTRMHLRGRRSQMGAAFCQAAAAAIWCLLPPFPERSAVRECVRAGGGRESARAALAAPSEDRVYGVAKLLVQPRP